MRRNILAYKAPPNNEGYDLICIHPNPRRASRQVRVQVKSRYATDSDRGAPVKSKSFGAFDYLVLVFQNIGYYFDGSSNPRAGLEPPEFYTLPVQFVVKQHRAIGKGWEVFKTAHLDLQRFRDEKGFEQIAQDLRIPYPRKADA
jgi:hypothetical protein